MTRIDATNAPTAAFEQTPEQALLAPMAGTWEGPTRLWLDPEAAPEETTSTARAEPLLGGRALRIDYQGTAMGGPHAGQFIVSFDGQDRQFVVAWLDSFHTGGAVMACTGPRREDGTVSVLGSYAAGDGPRWGWRTVIRLESPERLVVRAFNITPDGQEHRAITTEYRRTA